MSIRRQEALDYHSQGRPGKIQVSPTKPFKNQRDLSLAYTPGVAEPCREIAAHPDDAYSYTAKGNLVAVVTNGTAVLGLGNIGALAGKPVMEGKGILFKAFADIDVFDLEVGSDDPRDLVRFCQLLEPTVGGINLEDIRSPDCFYVEQALREQLSIPVFHDDQHGTAIITGAALVNALELVKKDIGKVRVVFAGAGAAADRVRPREPRSGNQPGGGPPGARRRHHRDRPLRLPEPGEQRAGLPVHIPRRARRAGPEDQRGDGDGGHARARRPRQGRGPRGGDARLRRRATAVRSRLPDPQTVRSAGALVGRAGGGVGGGGLRGGGSRDRRGRIPRRAGRASRACAGGDARSV